jgi:hypothetical protein
MLLLIDMGETSRNELALTKALEKAPEHILGVNAILKARTVSGIILQCMAAARPLTP